MSLAPEHDAPTCANQDCGGPMTPRYAYDGRHPRECPEDGGLHDLVCVCCGAVRKGAPREVLQAWWSWGAYCQRLHAESLDGIGRDWSARVMQLGRLPAEKRAPAVHKLCRDFDLAMPDGLEERREQMAQPL